MRTMYNSLWLIIATSLSLSACTDRTVVSGQPTSTDTDAVIETMPSPTLGDMPVTQGTNEESTATQTATGQTTSEQENTAPVVAEEAAESNTPVTLDVLDESDLETSEDNSESTPATGTETAEAEATPPVDELLSDPAAIPDAVTESSIESVTVGAPGESVDCNLTVPCRWLSDDSQFFVTVTNADNIGSLGRLVIEYSVSSLHDTQVNVSSTESAIDNAGGSYAPSALSLGEAIGGGTQGLLAGNPVQATIRFDRAGSADSIDYWSIGLSDSGLIRQPAFSGIPVGSATTEPADCMNTLPCIWSSPANDVTITLLSASGSGTINRLTTSFRVETTRNLAVAVDAGATAIGTDGVSYEGRTHTLGVETGAEKLLGDVIAGAQLSGTVFFSRTQSTSDVLQILSLVVYEDSPVPRWNPDFVNVPVQ